MRSRPCCRPPFQSHAGSIEARERERVHLAIVLFQSHAGSIEAYTWTVRLDVEPMFQSHAGSIEAHLAPDAIVDER